MKRSTLGSLVAVLSGALVVAALPVGNVGAQGVISMQGFGYPIGGLSTRTAGMAGAMGEFDLLTPRNPASIALLPHAVLSVQAEPEYRSVRLNSVKERTNVQRIPLVLMGLRISSRAVIAVSGAGFLDRSYSTVSTGSAIIEGASVPTTDQIVVKGAIADLRTAVGVKINERVNVGIAGHVFTGSNMYELSRQFADTTKFGSVLDSSTANFLGKAVSLGANIQLPRGLAAAASVRFGFGIDATRGDSVLSKANIPDRISGGLRYTGIAGSTFALDVEHVAWSDLNGLGSSNVHTFNANNVNLGAEVQGSKMRGSAVLYRVGVAKNTLPFGVGAQKVSEMRYGLGLGVPVAERDQATLDFSVQRANRKLAGSSAREGAWLLGIGLQIRP